LSTEKSKDMKRDADTALSKYSVIVIVEKVVAHAVYASFQHSPCRCMVVQKAWLRKTSVTPVPVTQFLSHT